MRPADIPRDLRTPRLHLRCWSPDDASTLLPVLTANVDRLRGWIPETVWSPSPLPGLVERLTGFAADFSADRAWRFAMFAAEDQTLLGEMSLFARSATARVPLEEADRLEIGYWLRAEATGQGFATEGARELLRLAAEIPGISHVEIRCDDRNAPSVAVAQRLGFTLDAGNDDPDSHTMIWSIEVRRG